MHSLPVITSIITQLGVSGSAFGTLGDYLSA